jgi:hypothetical protein
MIQQRAGTGEVMRYEVECQGIPRCYRRAFRDR